MSAVLNFVVFPWTILTASLVFGIKVYLFLPSVISLLLILSFISLRLSRKECTKSKKTLGFFIGFMLILNLILCIGVGILCSKSPYSMLYFARGALHALLIFVSLFVIYKSIFNKGIFAKKGMKIAILSIFLVCVAMSVFDYKPLYITSKPVIFDYDKDTYAVVWMTSTSSRAELTVTKNHETYHYKDTKDGIVNVYDNYNIAYVPKNILSGATYQTHNYNTLFYYPHNRYVSPLKNSSKIYEVNDNSEKEDIDFLVFNDLHNAADYKMSAIDVSKYDFAVYTGDIATFLETESDMSRLLNSFHNTTKGQIPAYYVVGNHEKRGKYGTRITDFIITPNKTLNYTFQYKDFIGFVMDTGEDYTDDGWIFTGQADYKNYALQQTEWLTNVVANLETDSYKTSAFFGHTTLSDKDGGDTVSQFPIWAKLLAEADVMVSFTGHTHSYSSVSANESGLGFHSFSGGGVNHKLGFDYEALSATINDGKITVQSIKNNGELVNNAVTVQ